MSLLPRHFLGGRRVAFSVSDSPDLPRLGLSPEHLQDVVAELARTVLVHGGSLAYGGDLRPGGFTEVLLEEVRRFGGFTEAPLRVYLAWPVHRVMTAEEIAARREALWRIGDLVCLDAEGHDVEPATLPPAVAGDTADDVWPKSLSALRRRVSGETAAVVVLGGRRSDFKGRYPGIVEEVLVATEARHPTYVAGGFGGAAADVLTRLTPAALAWLPPPDGQALPQAYRDGLAALDALAATRSWPDSFANGLDEAENVRLAATHRAAEIVDLVLRGLGKVLAADPAGNGNSRT
jgi:hypothetical protein